MVTCLQNTCSGLGSNQPVICMAAGSVPMYDSRDIVNQQTDVLVCLFFFGTNIFQFSSEQMKNTKYVTKHARISGEMS